MKKVIVTMWVMIFAIYNFSVAQNNQKEVELDPFTHLECSGGSMQVKLFPSDEEKLIIITPSFKQLQSVKIKQTGNTLSLRRESKNNNDIVKVAVHYKEIKSIECSGAIDVIAKDRIISNDLYLEMSGAIDVYLNLDVNQLKSDLSGAVDVTLKGKTHTHRVEISGAAELNAEELTTQITMFEASGASEANLYATEQIKGEKSGVADIHYNHSAKEIIINDKVVMSKKKSSGAFDDAQVYIIHKKTQDSILVNFSDYIHHISDTITNDYSISIIKGKTKIYISNPETSENKNVFIGNDDENNDKNIIVINSDGISFLKRIKKIFPKRKKFDGHWAGVSLGINGMMDVDRQLNFPSAYEKMALKYQKSINVSLNILEFELSLLRNNKKFGLVTGLGFMWDNYRFNNNVELNHESTQLMVDVADVNKNQTKSKLTVTYLNIPLLLELQSHKKRSMYISAGVVGGWRIGTHTKVKYGNGNKDKDRDDFFMNPLRADLMVRMGLGVVSLYGSYGLVPLFLNGKGPKMYPFNVGIHINF